MWMRMRTHAGLVCESDTFVAKDATSRLPRAEKLKTRPGDPVEQGRGKNKSASVSFIVRVDRITPGRNTLRSNTRFMFQLSSDHAGMSKPPPNSQNCYLWLYGFTGALRQMFAELFLKVDTAASAGVLGG